MTNLRNLLAITLLAVAVAGDAEPYRLEAQVGICKHGIADKGTWWNSDYPTKIDAESGCFSLGVSRITDEWRGYKLGWRATYLDFGRVTANNIFAMHDDEQFIGITGANCNPDNQRGCLGQGILSQETKGITLGGLIERDFGSWTFGGEFGGYVYYSRFRATVYPHHQPRSREPWTFDWAGTGFSPYLGATVNRGPFFATVRSYLSIRASESCTGCTGISSGLSYQAMAGIQIPL